MSKYINKDAVVAELNRIKKEECPIDTYEGRMKLFYFERFLSFINTLEVKEVDLEKELSILDNILFDLDGVAIAGATAYITVEDVKAIAKHFFELGLNAQK